MSIKNNIEMVKEELSSEDKLFETSVVTERFLKKYKTLIISGVAVVIVGLGANFAYETNKESKAVAANASLAQLSQQSDEKAMKNLKTLSPKLYDLYTYSQAIAKKDIESLKSLQSSKTILINELAKYESLKTVEELENYANNDEAIYKDLAQVRIAILHINNGKIQEAHESLRFISENSPLINVAKLLLHYGVK